MYLCKYSFLFSLSLQLWLSFPYSWSFDITGDSINRNNLFCIAVTIIVNIIILHCFFFFFFSHHLCLYKYYLKPISRTIWKIFVDFKVFLWFILCDMFILIAFCNYHGLWIWSVVICCVYGAFLKPDLSRVNRGNNWKADSTPFRDFNKLGAADS